MYSIQRVHIFNRIEKSVLIAMCRESCTYLERVVASEILLVLITINQNFKTNYSLILMRYYGRLAINLLVTIHK